MDNKFGHKKILLIEIFDYQSTPAEIVERFWWSDENGLTCDSKTTIDTMNKDGIMVPPGKIIYPKDGRIFFDGLKFAFSGSFIRALEPKEVQIQEGFPFKNK